MCKEDVPIAHDDHTSNSHGGSPRAHDDLVLVLQRPLLELGLRVHHLPATLLHALLAVELGLAGAGPGGLVELDAAALGLDGVAGRDDEDDTERLEVGREGAVVRPVALHVEGGGEGEDEAAEHALDGAADGRGVMAGELFLSGELYDKR